MDDRVLVINSYTPTFPTTKPLLDAIFEELPGVHVDVEYLASKAAWSDEYAADALDHLRRRASTRQPYDVVIATDDHALELVFLDDGQTFAVPVVSVGINDPAKFEVERPLGLTGAIEHIDLRGTVQLAQTLQPKLKRVALVFDGSASGDAHLRVAEDQLGDSGVQVVPVSLREGEAAAMQQLAWPDEDAQAVIVLSAHITGGLEEEYDEVHRRLCLDGARWCYTPFLFAIEAGVVGGSVISLADHGHIAGRYARALLDGEDSSSLPVIGSEPRGLLVRSARASHPTLRAPDGFSWYPQRRVPPFVLGLAGLGITALLVGLGIGLWTRRRETGSALTEEERHLADVGRVAVGVVHDLNNLLTVVQGYQQIIDEEHALPEQARDELRQIGVASNRASRLTYRVLSWASQKTEKPEPLIVGEHLADLAAVLRRILGREVQLHFIVDPKALAVVASPTALDQMVLNLVSNARDAGARSVQLEVVEVDLDAPRALLSTTVAAGQWVVVRSTDDGKGVDEEKLERLLGHGASTKRSPGTGIGLDTVVRRLGELEGGYDLRPNEGGGAIAELWLPRLSGDEAQQVQAPVLDTLQSLRGSERVIVLDDDPDVRRVLRRTFEVLGYTVQTYRSGRSAVEQLAGAPRPDLAVVDVGLGAMRGPEVVRRLQAQMGAFPVIYVSGSGEAEDGLTPVVEKPFDTMLLMKLARGLLDEG